MEYNLCVPCLFGLESLVADELREMGFDRVSAENGRVNFGGSEESIAKANIGCRFGERVLLTMGSFRAQSFDELFEGTKALEWEKIIPENGAFPVKGSLRNSKLHSVPDAQSIIKKAIVERLSKAYGIKWFSEDGPKYQIQFLASKDDFTIYIDTTGPGLHKRGYRSSSVAAPLRETLAAAMVKLSRWRGDRMLIDPFCGSGTIPIEAALIAGKVAPGLFRRFEAESWPILPKSVWTSEKENAREKITPPGMHIYGSDISPAGVALAEDNARKAGVSGIVSFSVKDALTLDFSACAAEGGYMITNPPYGERISDTAEVEKLYRDFASHLEKFPSLKRFIISNHADFERIFGTADRRRKLYNGMLVCSLYSYAKRPLPGAESGL